MEDDTEEVDIDMEEHWFSILEGLPDPLLSNISSYLPGDGILLAVALTASASSWENFQHTNTTNNTQNILSQASKAVLGVYHTDTGDWRKKFEDIDFGLMNQYAGSTPGHNRLNDIDLKAILICIDAHNNLKSLILTGCVSISGRGLLPSLCGSTVLQRIDLSLVSEKYESNNQGAENVLSEADVLPVLRSIILKGEQSSLKHIQLPLKWRNGRSTRLTTFLDEYHYTRLD